MSNPVVLITGGLTGIGRAAAIAFAKKGAKVVVAGRRDEAGKALVKELRSFGSEAEFFNADVRKEDDVRALADKTIARFGRLDVAGEQCWHRRPSWPDHGPDRGELRRDVRHECSRRDPEHEARSARHARIGQRQHYQHLLDLRARGCGGGLCLCRQQACRRRHHQIGRARGCQVGNSCERRGARPYGHRHDPFYGLVTGVPMGRLGLSEELANAIVFIASDEASLITGRVLNVDGGKTAG
jgi:hypothetical protein